MLFVFALTIANMLLQYKEPILKDVRDSYGISFGKGFMQYFILLSYMIPISLVVTVEILKMAHMLFIHWDYKMYYEEFGYSELHNSNLIVTLAEITHVLSDKTGTLTENIMQLVNFTDVNGPHKSEDFIQDISENYKILEKSSEFIHCLALCNNIVVFHNPNGETEYNAESPDEASFVKFAAQCGIKLNEHDPTSIELHSIQENGENENEKYKIVSFIPFNSDRKRSTIVLQKEGTDQLVVYSKCADSVMYPLCNQNLYSGDVNKYAIAGFRTLVFAKRVLFQEEAEEWLSMWKDAES